MPVSLPNFNLTFDLWVATNPNDQPVPDFAGVPCQVYIHSRADIDQILNEFSNWLPPVYLRVPIGGPKPQKGDVVQVIHLALDYYRVLWTQNIHMGFPNEYVMCLVSQCGPDGFAR